MLTGSGSIIPLYIYPKTENGGNAWQQLYDAYRAHPVETWAIVNVFNGPGDATDANFVNGINELHNAGINTLGYVRTNYTERSQVEVKADIDKWKQVYNIKGIFFDEMANENNNAKIAYYEDVNSHAKAQGLSFTVGNPGIGTDPKYFNTVDNIVIYETDKGFPSKDSLCAQDTNGHGRKSVSILPYNIASLDRTAVTEAKDCAGYIFVTDDNGDNPWDTLPYYLTQLFETLKN